MFHDDDEELHQEVVSTLCFKGFWPKPKSTLFSLFHTAKVTNQAWQNSDEEHLFHPQICAGYWWDCVENQMLKLGIDVHIFCNARNHLQSWFDSRYFHLVSHIFWFRWKLNWASDRRSSVYWQDSWWESVITTEMFIKVTIDRAECSNNALVKGHSSGFTRTHGLWIMSILDEMGSSHDIAKSRTHIPREIAPCYFVKKGPCG